MSLTTQVPSDQLLINQSNAQQSNSDDVLAALVYHVSALAHSDVQIGELVERTGSLVLYSLHADSIRIVLRDARAGFARDLHGQPGAHGSRLRIVSFFTADSDSRRPVRAFRNRNQSREYRQREMASHRLAAGG